MSVSAIQANVLCTLDRMGKLAPEWQDVWRRCPGASTFQRAEWLLAWTEAFRPREIRLVEFRRDSQLVGVAPLLIYPRDGQRVLAFMGGGVSDYLDVLVHPGWERETMIFSARRFCNSRIGRFWISRIYPRTLFW